MGTNYIGFIDYYDVRNHLVVNRHQLKQHSRLFGTVITNVSILRQVFAALEYVHV